MPLTMPIRAKGRIVKVAHSKEAAAPLLEPIAVGAAEAARLCGVSRATWYAMRKAGRLPRPVRLGGRVVWRVGELRAWMNVGCPSLSRWESMREPLRD